MTNDINNLINRLINKKKQFVGAVRKVLFYVIAGLTRNLKYRKKVEMPDQVRHDGIRVTFWTTTHILTNMYIINNQYAKKSSIKNLIYLYTQIFFKISSPRISIVYNSRRKLLLLAWSCQMCGCLNHWWNWWDWFTLI